MLALAELHLHAMLGAPAFGRSLLACGLLLCGEALEQGFQPCQQTLFVAIPQGHLHLTVSQGDLDIRTRRSLRQCRLRFLPACGRSQHPCGVFGIYRASSGRCVTFHQPLRDTIVKEQVNMDIILSNFR